MFFMLCVMFESQQDWGAHFTQSPAGDPDSLTPHNSSPGAGAQVEVERLLRCWVERLGAVAGRPTQWLHREVARLLWPEQGPVAFGLEAVGFCTHEKTHQQN